MVVALSLVTMPLSASDPLAGLSATGPGLTATQCCYQPPRATFTVSQGGLLTYSFNASGSYDPDGSIVSYHWDFGDGETATTSSPTISHQFGGDQYYVTLTVTDNHNLCDQYTKFVSTCGGPNQPVCPY